MENGNGPFGIFLSPLAIGLYIGLAFSLFVFTRGKVTQRRMKRETELLKRHLQMKLDVESEEHVRRKKEMEDLKKENENLRVAIREYAARPGRRELRLLRVYQNAVERLTEMAPGFAQSWQSALREAEDELRKAEQGLLPLMKRFIPWTGGGSGKASRAEKGSS